MSQLDARIAELAAKYLPLASEMLKEIGEQIERMPM